MSKAAYASAASSSSSRELDGSAWQARRTTLAKSAARRSLHLTDSDQVLSAARSDSALSSADAARPAAAHSDAVLPARLSWQEVIQETKRSTQKPHRRPVSTFLPLRGSRVRPQTEETGQVTAPLGPTSSVDKMLAAEIINAIKDPNDNWTLVGLHEDLESCVGVVVAEHMLRTIRLNKKEVWAGIPPAQNQFPSAPQPNQFPLFF